MRRIRDEFRQKEVHMQYRYHVNTGSCQRPRATMATKKSLKFDDGKIVAHWSTPNGLKR
jgi:hypothetical protein